MTPRGFQILYEEGPCLVAAKPGGLLSQAPPGVDSLEVRVKRFLKKRDQKPGRVYLALAHRLDRPASGALVLARHQRAARRLGEQFQGRTVAKKYWALVQGEVAPDAGTWRDMVRKTPGEARAETVAHDHPDAREAVLRYQVRGRCDGASWLEIELETGRTHQIRLQAAARGHPILGDRLYGSLADFGPATADPRERWIALHARSLEFDHPMTHERANVVAPLSGHWAQALQERSARRADFADCLAAVR